MNCWGKGCRENENWKIKKMWFWFPKFVLVELWFFIDGLQNKSQIQIETPFLWGLVWFGAAEKDVKHSVLFNDHHHKVRYNQHSAQQRDNMDHWKDSTQLGQKVFHSALGHSPLPWYPFFDSLRGSLSESLKWVGPCLNLLLQLITLNVQLYDYQSGSITPQFLAERIILRPHKFFWVFQPTSFVFTMQV